MSNFHLSSTSDKVSTQKNSITLKARAFKLSAILFVALFTTPLISYSQDVIKVVDLSTQEQVISQDYEAWCVYACLEAVSGVAQCEQCRSYLDGYIGNLYNADTDPYPYNAMTPVIYNVGMNDFMNNDIGPCDNGEEFAKFSVLSNHMSDFIGNEIGSYDAQLNICTGNVSHPIFSVKEQNGIKKHCVLYMGSTIFNEDYEDPRSVVVIMDPAEGAVEELSADSFFTDYWEFYSQNN